MSIIEQRISKNKKVFDVHEPDEGHFEKFRSKLQELHPETPKGSRRRMLPLFMKVAAGLLILLAASSILFNYPSLYQKDLSDEIGGELAELDQYYTAQYQKKYEEIKNIVADDEEMQAMKDKAMHKVNRLEDNREKLQEEYIEANKNERVYGALVANYRMLSRALDKVIDSMSEVKHKKSSN